MLPMVIFVGALDGPGQFYLTARSFALFGA
jgi:hypothetical protein